MDDMTETEQKDIELQYSWEHGRLKVSRQQMMAVFQIYKLQSITIKADGTLTFVE
jgi:hypothetical protein